MPCPALVSRSFTWIAAAAVVSLPLFSPGGPLSLVNVSAERSTLTITGTVSNLVPGHVASLALTVHNVSDRPAEVSSLSARVTAASAGCRPAALSIGHWAGLAEVPAHGTRTIALPVRLTAGPGECSGATWQLAYSSS